jgi:membrane-associated protein
MDDIGSFLIQVKEVCLNLFNIDGLIALLSHPEFIVAAFVVLNLVIFTETGLLVGFCLPGDSLLVSTGLVWWTLVHDKGVAGWTLPLLLGTLCLSAIVGDTVGYWIGYKTGPRIFSREKSFFFRKDHLLKAQEFYEKHGGKTIILARFMPIIRTFAPVVAGVGQMQYRRFLYFNIFGGIGWVCSMVLLGYVLTPVLNPMLRPVFGNEFKVEQHIEKVIILVVFLSISPGIYAWMRAKMSRPIKVEEPVVVQTP